MVPVSTKQSMFSFFTMEITSRKSPLKSPGIVTSELQELLQTLSIGHNLLQTWSRKWL
jgi:hypothetical protein